ncbi:MAG: ABC transporter permease [Candidatus Aminicenantes bacterium]|nr:ABC transporter permease [Candidatus Aminicenantes bacterium]
MNILWNHLKFSLRIFQKQKLTAAINIIGLGIGLSFFFLLVAYVHDELSYDRFHKNADQTYILTSEFRNRFVGGSHHFIAEKLEDEFPEVKPGSTVRYGMHSQTVMSENGSVVMDFAFTDPNFFDMFSFDFLEGTPSQALSLPNNIVITAETAQSLYSGIDPVGQFITILMGETYKDFLISGIIENIPGNSSLQFDGILHYSHVFDAYQIDKNNNDFVTLPIFTTTFLNLSDDRDVDSLRSKLPAFSNRIYGAMWKSVNMELPKQGFDLLKLSDYHLGSVNVGSLVSHGNSSFSWILSGIAFLILILACVNSVNISLALSSTRLKEIGVRKVIGARKNQIFTQMLTESLLTGVCALIVGHTVAVLLISPFNAITNKKLMAKMLLSVHTLPVVLGSVLLVCLFIGLIPAQSFSRYNAWEVLKGSFLVRNKNRLSIILIVFQFTVSLFFIIGTLVITRQLHYMASFDLGYDPTNLILVHTQVPGERAFESQSMLELFRSELQSDSGVRAVSADSGSVGSYQGSVTRNLDKEGVEYEVDIFMIDYDYLEVLGVTLLAGQDFSSQLPLETGQGILVNEAFVKEFELKDPVGKKFSDFAKDKLPAQYTFDPVIIGVVKDFHVFSLHEPIGPMAFSHGGFPQALPLQNILVKVKEGKDSDVLKRLESIWKTIRPDIPFSYTFLDDALAWEYRRERDWGRIVGWSTGFALFIACIGLFGLSAVTVVQRTKEIGIRKVLGASVTDIFTLLSKYILKWMLVSNLLAWPFAFFAARSWLDQFAYRISINLWIFALAALLSLFVVGITVSWHAAKAAVSDPVQSLRYE